MTTTSVRPLPASASLAERRALALRLRAEGLTLRQIAAVVDRSFQAVHDWLKLAEDPTFADRENARKRAWEASQATPCIDCHGPTSQRLRSRCRECDAKHRSATAARPTCETCSAPLSATRFRWCLTCCDRGWGRNRRWDRADILAAFRRHRDLTGAWPNQSLLQSARPFRPDYLPQGSTVYRHFETHMDAIDAAANERMAA